MGVLIHGHAGRHVDGDADSVSTGGLGRDRDAERRPRDDFSLTPIGPARFDLRSSLLL